VATKYTLSTRQDDPNAGGNHRKNLMQALHASLRRLNSDYVDLYWLHMWDFLTPVEEVMRALDDVVRAGQVLYVGISDTPAWVVAQANTLAEWRGWSRLVALQLPYSLGTRDAERELLPMARAFEMAVTPWGLLEGGELTGKYNQPARKQAKQGNDQVHGPRRNSRASRENLALAGELVALGAEIGRSPSQIAINWVRQQPQRAPMIPIVGARSAAQLADNLGCLDWQLTPEQLQRLDAASAIPLGFPQSFLGSQHVGELIFGNTRALIDNHRG
jgi:aryl-alcohol dehydrogenase-like predicted oxidoreductase